jgi:hypothetical protein
VPYCRTKLWEARRARDIVGAPVCVRDARRATGICRRFFTASSPRDGLDVATRDTFCDAFRSLDARPAANDRHIVAGSVRVTVLRALRREVAAHAPGPVAAGRQPEAAVPVWPALRSW